LIGFRKNIHLVTKSLQDQKYEALKAHAEEKLEEANKEIENIARSQVSSQPGFRIRIRIDLALLVPGPGGQKLPTKIGKSE
jgi:hypothetical protein